MTADIIILRPRQIDRVERLLALIAMAIADLQTGDPGRALTHVMTIHLIALDESAPAFLRLQALHAVQRLSAMARRCEPEPAVRLAARREVGACRRPPSARSLSPR
jgi:hypothetical protein